MKFVTHVTSGTGGERTGKNQKTVIKITPPRNNCKMSKAAWYGKHLDIKMGVTLREISRGFAI